MSVIRLYQFPGNRRTINFSPFCLKLETYLKMIGTPYEVVTTSEPFKAPKKKLPYIELDGNKIADSGFILDFLKEKNGDDLDRDLTDLQKAQARLLTKTFEKSLRFVLLYSRWVDDAGWEKTKSIIFRGLKPPAAWLVPNLVRKKTAGSLMGQGYGLHSRDEIYSIGTEDLRAISTLLGEKPFFFGDKPTSVDATAFGHLQNICEDMSDSPLKLASRHYPNLAAYAARMRGKYFPEKG